MKLSFQIRGLDKIVKTLDVLIDQPLRNFFERSLFTVQGRAREGAPVDRGQLRAGTTVEIDSSSPPLWGKVGVKQGVKAKVMEFGAGLLSEAPDSKRSRFFPPWGDQNPELELWARRHGFKSGFEVALAIYKRGGIAPRRFLRNAIRDSKSDIERFGRDLIAEIKEIWESSR